MLRCIGGRQWVCASAYQKKKFAKTAHVRMYVLTHTAQSIRLVGGAVQSLRDFFPTATITTCVPPPRALFLSSIKIVNRQGSNDETALLKPPPILYFCFLKVRDVSPHEKGKRNRCGGVIPASVEHAQYNLGTGDNV